MDTWEDELKGLKDEYLFTSKERLQRVKLHLDRLSNFRGDRDSLSNLHREFHAFSGSGATYGFPKVSSLGLQGEEECSVRLHENAEVTSEDLIRWNELRRKLLQELSETSPTPLEIAEAGPFPNTKDIEILVVNDDNDTCERLSALLSKEGIKVRVSRDKQSALEELHHQSPQGMVVDVRLPDGSGYEVVEHVRGLPDGQNCVVLMISGVAGFLDKVEAIHCGADAYFDKPIDWTALIRRLNILLEARKTVSSRILYVEDDLDQASFCRMILESAGYEVRICEDPKYFESDLSSFDPDLLLMDILLPSASGLDLVRLIRKDERFATLPIIFLTTQNQLGARIGAVKAGGDDYLTKPVFPGLLLSSVVARLERSRFLKSLIQIDGLTGLLTHSAFHERARVLLAKVKRDAKMSPVLAMMDLDHFKALNDRYGHLIGDRVLAALGSFLRRHLRQSDIVGRYGGEEFSVIVEDLSLEDADRLFSRLSREFSTLGHLAGNDETFYATLSAGIATLDTDTMDLEKWIEAADKALYAAKTAGRNRVVVYSPEMNG